MGHEEKLSVSEIVKRLSTEPKDQPPEKGLLDEYGPILNVKNASEITGLCGKSIREKLAAGEIPGRQVGRIWLIPRDTFDDYLHGDDVGAKTPSLGR